jgi:hypothetical protein
MRFFNFYLKKRNRQFCKNSEDERNMTLICITYANLMYGTIVISGCISKYGVGFLFLLVSELVFGDTCFLMSERKVLTPFLLMCRIQGACRHK